MHLTVWKELHQKVGSNVQQVREECYLHKHKDRENKKSPNFSNVTINGIYVRRPDVVIGKKGRDLYHIESTKNIQ